MGEPYAQLKNQRRRKNGKKIFIVREPIKSSQNNFSNNEIGRCLTTVLKRTTVMVLVIMIAFVRN
jgi:hypothetical protein